jgi:RimJ/RimL family protein N-acetyltransferase
MYGGDPSGLPPYTVADAEREYARWCAEPHGWMIDVEGRAVGHARLHTLDQAHRSARFAIGLFDVMVWSRGYGTEATRLVLRYAFEELGLHRVDLRVLEYNRRAIACYEKCGFVREGLERDSALVAGEWQSDVRMSILEHEYRALAPNWSPIAGEA